MKSLLELQDIYLNYKTENSLVEVIKGVNLKINSGENVAVVGKSGSGKTSLIMLIAGLEKVTSGKIIFEDQDISPYSEDELADLRKRKIGIVFQSFYLIPNYTALENVSLVLEINKIENAQKKSAELLDQFGLKDRLNHFPSQLSGGEQQRVSIARAFVNRPLILLADEPTGNLDPTTSEGIMGLLDEINQTGTTVVMATHDHRVVNAMRRRVIQLDRGVIVRDQERGVYE